MKEIRIGTRDSRLAMWQAEQVAAKLSDLGLLVKIVPVKSQGDLDLHTPLNQFGTTGVFTKILDEALWQDRVDIAVHSLKDYPTQTPEKLELAAVLERGPVYDVVVHKGSTQFLEGQDPAKVATGSIRRIAQWKSRYPQHQNPNLRGNVQTRLRKLRESDWHGAIFAQAGLARLGMLQDLEHEVLDWMIPAPAQGIVGITCRTADQEIKEVLAKINHPETFLRAKVERGFLRQAEGGCSAPIGALAEIDKGELKLKAGVFSLDGSQKVIVENTIPLNEADGFGEREATRALEQGAKTIMQNIKNAQ